MAERKRVQKDFKKPTLTKSEPGRMGPIGDSVNRLLRGDSVVGMRRQPLPAGDYTAVPDLQTSLTIARRAQEKFAALPAVIRDRFRNDPNRLNEFLLSTDEADIAESYKLGLRVKPKAAPPQDVRVINPVPEGGDPVE